MGMNKQKGNMYPFVTHTWNPIRGKCPNGCVYCYMKVYPQPELHFVEKEMETNLGNGNFIFVGSSTDAWLGRSDWLQAMLHHCREFPLNRYLFQTKCPYRFAAYLGELPPNSVLGTTIETNRLLNGISKAPATGQRMWWMRELTKFPKMVSIEPIMDFDPDFMIDWIKQIEPEFVSIGADSKGHNLPEPSSEKVNRLIEELSKFTVVKIKDNLARLRPEIK
jgi:DNA repair photolyase